MVNYPRPKCRELANVYLSSEVSSFSHIHGRLSALQRHFHGVQLGMNTPISIYFSQLGQFLHILGISASVIKGLLPFLIIFCHKIYTLFVTTNLLLLLANGANFWVVNAVSHTPALPFRTKRCTEMRSTGFQAGQRLTEQPRRV